MSKIYSALTIAAVTTLMTSSAFAAGECSKADAAKFKPQADLETMLAKDGLKVKKVKVEKGCYEVYAIDKAGKKVNVAFNAETLEKAKSPEAGEN
jgi:hypothetical protein